MLVLYRHPGCEFIAPSRHGLQYALIKVTNCSANISNAVRDRIIGNDNIVPDRTIYGVAVQELPRIRDEHAQQVEGLGPKGDFCPVRVEQRSTCEIESIPPEPVNRL